MATQTVEPVLVSRCEAARMLGVSRNTIIRLAERGKLREVRFSPEMHPRIPVSDVLALAGTGDADDATSGARPNPDALVADHGRIRPVTAERYLRLLPRRQHEDDRHRM